MENKKRLIDANALLLEIEEELAHESPFFTKEQNELIDCGLRIAAKDIRYQPTVDAVEVVLCKDCKHSACNPVKLTYACRHPSGLRGFINEGYYFCSHGERRGENEKEGLTVLFPTRYNYLWLDGQQDARYLIRGRKGAGIFLRPSFIFSGIWV